MPLGHALVPAAADADGQEGVVIARTAKNGRRAGRVQPVIADASLAVKVRSPLPSGRIVHRGLVIDLGLALHVARQVVVGRLAGLQQFLGLGEVGCGGMGCSGQQQAGADQQGALAASGLAPAYFVGVNHLVFATEVHCSHLLCEGVFVAETG